MEKEKRQRIPKRQAPQIGEIEWMLKAMGLKYEKEYKFSPNRKFKADLAIPSLKVLIEYEGLFSPKSRHTTATGYTTDTEKYWLANCLGWKVLRVTSINYKRVPEFLRMLELPTERKFSDYAAMNCPEDEFVSPKNTVRANISGYGLLSKSQNPPRET